MVGQMFAELGCEVETSIELENVRGKKEIDVFVRDVLNTPVAIYRCHTRYSVLAGIGGGALGLALCASDPGSEAIPRQAFSCTHSISLLLGAVPTLVAVTAPFLKIMRVGMPRTP
jgi:hypothetical protein